jgi:hypothetical protein
LVAEVAVHLVMVVVVVLEDYFKVQVSLLTGEQFFP